MDGVTDAACRYITATLGKPALLFTEFTAAEGIRAGATRLLHDFHYHPAERPVIAQIFGVDPHAFTVAAAVAAALGFDGVDINMGCPAKNVSHRGAGAALIGTPERASEIIEATRAGVDHWARGGSLTALGVPPRLQTGIATHVARIEAIEGKPLSRRHLPVSVKTRIGISESTIETWASHLATHSLDAVTFHGRTLKQLYTGSADWEQIALGARILKSANPSTIVLGNGDISSIAEGTARAQEAGVDGFLIGRAAIGNPWIFSNTTPSSATRIETALAQAQYLSTITEDRGIPGIRKHLLEYTKSFPGAKKVRLSLMQVHTVADVEALLTDPALLG
jgi:tRNA-dihydrouridine synthase